MSGLNELAERLRALADGKPLGVVIVDHGSKRSESNDLLLEVTELFRQSTNLPIVQPAHMELAEPTIGQAFDRAVAAGAQTVVVLPYFFAPGRHMTEDIPRLAAEAAARHSGVSYRVAAPLGVHPAMMQILADRLTQAFEG